MNIHIKCLTLVCKRAIEVIDFSDLSYFYGEIGAGKSSIAHLLDYCLGGTLHETPALQSEFVEAELALRVGKADLVLTRVRGSAAVHASWQLDDTSFDAMVPARDASEEVVAGTGISVLSDLIFHLAEMKAPRVRRSKLKEDSELVRLSLRDILWFCYLDQAQMESTFFHLEATAEFSLRNKSKDVLRFILGFHQEHIAELERELDALRIERRARADGAKALQAALAEANLGSESDIDKRLAEISRESDAVEEETRQLRQNATGTEVHGADDLRKRGRALVDEIVATEDAIQAVEQIIQDERRHLNELRMLGIRFRRSDTARAILRGVTFKGCPSCTRPLPARDSGTCPVCGQKAMGADVSQGDLEVAERDAQARQVELKESIDRHSSQLRRFARDLSELRISKASNDAELSDALKQYDSVLMSYLLTLENRKATLKQEGVRLEQLRVLPARVSEMLESADNLTVEEARVRRELTSAREEAERDSGNLRRLEDLFRDCLVRSKLPGIGDEHVVSIQASTFYPHVFKRGEENVIVAHHGNLRSGGKVTIFKCCFAIALHRLAVEVNSPLPTLLIIDTPMKNISERTNRPIFEAFYDMIYELALTEFKGTQIILIDKEFKPPIGGFTRNMVHRYMTPADPKHPPLIGYYRE